MTRNGRYDGGLRQWWFTHSETTCCGTIHSSYFFHSWYLKSHQKFLWAIILSAAEPREGEGERRFHKGSARSDSRILEWNLSRFIFGLIRCYVVIWPSGTENFATQPRISCMDGAAMEWPIGDVLNCQAEARGSGPYQISDFFIFVVLLLRNQEQKCHIQSR